MKHIFNKIGMWACLSLLLFASCDRENLDVNNSTSVDVNGNGQIDFTSLNVQVATNEGQLNEVVSKAVDNTIDVSNYIIRVSGGNIETQEWVYNQLPELITLPVGTYTLEAMSEKNVPVAAFDKPYYYATREVSVVKNQIIDLGTLVCKLNNIKVTVSYDAELQKYMGAGVTTTVTALQSKGVLEFTNAAQIGYFSVEETETLRATLQGEIEGEKVVVSKEFANIAPGYQVNIKFSLKNVDSDFNTETGTIVKPGESEDNAVTIDVDLEVRKDGIFSIDSDDLFIDEDDDPNEGIVIDPIDPVDPIDPIDPIDPDDQSLPTIVGKSFAGESFDIDEAKKIPGQVELVVTLNAPKGMAHVNVTIDSETLTEEILTGVNLASSFDLAEPGSLAEGLKGLGFPVGNEVIGATTVDFDITQFTPLLGIYGAATHKFVIQVVDKEGKQITKTLTLITE